MTIEVEAELSRRCHPACIACGVHNGESFGLRFEEQEDGAVAGVFSCTGKYQGYPDRLHGGVVALLADAAMTHCLFVRRIRAVTGKLKLRFPKPVEVGLDATVRATLARSSPPWYELRAEIVQGGVVRATAEGLFIEQKPDTASARH